jgi:hypothetical protein
MTENGLVLGLPGNHESDAVRLRFIARLTYGYIKMPANSLTDARGLLWRL